AIRSARAGASGGGSGGGSGSDASGGSSVSGGSSGAGRGRGSSRASRSSPQASTRSARPRLTRGRAITRTLLHPHDQVLAEPRDARRERGVDGVGLAAVEGQLHAVVRIAPARVGADVDRRMEAAD